MKHQKCKYLSTREVADYFGVSTLTIRRWGECGFLRIVRLAAEGYYGGILRVDRASVEKLEKSAKTIPASPHSVP